MRNVHAPISKVQNLLRPFNNQHRLDGLVETMAQKIELLDEDNRQLRAAISIYREIIRRSNSGNHTFGNTPE
jgi:hypothetical protein